MLRDEENFASPLEDDFTDFVAATRARAGRLAYALTGDVDAAADLAEGAYARVRGRWSELDEAGAGAELRDQLLSLAKGSAWSDEELVQVAEVGWPEIPVSGEAAAQRAGERRTRRTVLFAGLGGLAVAALGAGVWRALPGDQSAPGSPPPPDYPGLEVVGTQSVPLADGTLDLDHLRDERGRQWLAVRSNGLVLGTLTLQRGQLVALVSRDHGRLAVGMSDPVEWMNVYGERAAPGAHATLVSVDGLSIGLAPVNDNVELAVGGSPDGELVVFPQERAWGTRFQSRPVWAYLTANSLVARSGIEEVESLQTVGSLPMHQLRLRDGSLVFGVWDAQDVAIPEGPRYEVEVTMVVQNVVVGLVPPQSEPYALEMSWTTYEGEHYSVLLGS
ncbi:hypothetical protein ACPCG0_00315 [Propionibacteriaceae bacterium Y1923]|uniref:hypothetical protein n=1 Tax=Aestuariimicrobium sp. Y1814 TaxID=3418742 RepID=UPI003C2564F4